MTLTDLRYLLALGRERHFGRAAAACSVSQPTLSVALKKLEAQWGVTLFDRQPAAVVPTSLGAAVLAQATRVLEEAERLNVVARAGSDPFAAPLRLGALFTVGPYLFPPLIAALRGRAPTLPLLVEEHFTATLSERLWQGQLDAIIVSEPFERGTIRCWRLYEEPFVVALSPSHPWAAYDHIEPAFLKQEHALLLSSGHCFRDQVLQYCPALQRGRDSLHATFEGSSLETIRYMVATGVGIAVLPLTAARAGAEAGLIIYRPLAGTPPVRRLVLAARDQFPYPTVLKLLRDTIRAHPPAGIAAPSSPG